MIAFKPMQLKMFKVEAMLNNAFKVNINSNLAINIQY